MRDRYKVSAVYGGGGGEESPDDLAAGDSLSETRFFASRVQLNSTTRLGTYSGWSLTVYVMLYKELEIEIAVVAIRDS